MEDPGSLFSAVEVEAPATSSDGPAAEPDSDFDFPEPQVISSDDLNAGLLDDPEALVEQADPLADPVVSEPGTDMVAEDVVMTAEPPVTDIMEDPAVSVSPPPAAMAVAPVVPNSWPIRLVKTLPETNPPRAIIGLPSGEELVVSPGSMVPEHGLVIIAIGPNSAQVAQVTPQGDHAAISPMTLQTMY